MPGERERSRTDRSEPDAPQNFQADEGSIGMAKREPKLLRLSVAAHELGLHPMTVRRWIKAGRIQVVQVGRETRVPRSEIERIVGTFDGRLLVLYGRVSGHGQLDDLHTQLERLKDWAKAERPGQETL